MIGNMQDVTELDRIGVTVVSVRESWLDTGGPVPNLLLAIFGWCAEQERARLIERTKAGLATARRRGKRLGRPRAERRHLDQKGARLDVDAARALIAAGASCRAAARQLGASEATVRRALHRTGAEPLPGVSEA
jgi:DNA invertase Pin-like site-specific DNA recombinase